MKVPYPAIWTSLVNKDLLYMVSKEIFLAGHSEQTKWCCGASHIMSKCIQ